MRAPRRSRFDIVFSEADRTSPRSSPSGRRGRARRPAQLAALRALPDHDARFAETLAAAPAVLGFFLTQDRPGAPVRAQGRLRRRGQRSRRQPHRAIRARSCRCRNSRQAAAGLGFVSIKGDADGIIRRVPLVARADGTLVPSLSAEALRVAQGAGGMVVRSSDASGEINAGAPEAVGLKIGEAEVPVTERGEIWMHYTAAGARADGAGLEDDVGAAAAGRDAAALLGPDRPDRRRRDRPSRPRRDADAERELGVVVHAQAIEQMVLAISSTGPTGRRGSKWRCCSAPGMPARLAAAVDGRLAAAPCSAAG